MESSDELFYRYIGIKGFGHNERMCDFILSLNLDEIKELTRRYFMYCNEREEIKWNDICRLTSRMYILMNNNHN